MKRAYPSEPIAFQSNNPIKAEHLDIKRQVPLNYASHNSNHQHVQLGMGGDISSSASTTAVAAAASAASTQPLPHNGLNAEEARKYEELRKRVSSFIPPCKNCPVKRVILDQQAGAYICTECGLQTGVYIIESAEWRNFSQDGGGVSNNSRATVDNADFGTSTMIDGKSSLATRHTQSNSSREQRRLNATLQECHRIKSTLGLSSAVVDRAHEIVRNVIKFTAVPDEEGKVKLPSQTTLAAVAMFRACAQLQQDRRMTDFIAASGVANSRAFNRGLRLVTDIERQTDPIQTKEPWVEPNNLARSYCERLNLSLDFIDLVHAIITTAKMNNISSGSKSAPLAAATIYFAQLIKPETRTKDASTLVYDLYVKSSVGIDTIRKIARELYEKRLVLVPEQYADKKTIETMPFP